MFFLRLFILHQFLVPYKESTHYFFISIITCKNITPTLKNILRESTLSLASGDFENEAAFLVSTKNQI
jgi:hypothetical protein